MADLYVKKCDMINPFVVASSPATQGAANVLKSAKMRPGAIVLRNYGHGSGGGSFIGPDSKAMFGGEMAIHSHAVGRQIPDSVDTLEKYCEEVHKIKKEMDSDIKLWVSVGHYSDIVKGGDWEKSWAHQAEELALAGADAIELHFNTPGVAVAKDRTFAYHQLLRHSIELMKKTVPNMPIMAKLAIESTDALTSMRIAEAAGACAVMALERIPADIRAAGGISRMSDPKMIKGIQEAVSIPVMAKCRIGHFVEAQILEAIEIDYIDESEVLSPADDVYHINKRDFKVPFVCGARDLGEALRRINEGASMIRTKGEPGTGDIVQAVRHMRKMNSEIAKLTSMREDELFEAAKNLQVPFELVKFVHDNGKLPVVNFAAGGVATPADAALMMQLGAEGVFVGSGIFKSGDPAKRAAAIVKAVTNFTDAKLIAELSEDLGEAMVGINESEIKIIMEERGK